MTENPMSIKCIKGTAVPVLGNDIDTDRIIPARFLRSITFEGLGEEVFKDERFRDDGTEKEHPFNHHKYKSAAILIVNQNFGCGSSREHAPQAIMRFGIKAIIGESFAEIFGGNCTSLGIPVFTGDSSVIRELQKIAGEGAETEFSLNLEDETVKVGQKTIQLNINPSAKTVLLEGRWNTLDELLLNEEKIVCVYSKLPYIAH